MKLDDLNSWTMEELESDIAKGGKFVIFTYTISILIMTFRRPSDIYYIKSDELSVKHGIQYLLISALLGWWGVPWGPIYTVQSIWYSFVGKDITEEVKYEVMQNMRCGNPNHYDTGKLMS